MEHQQPPPAKPQQHQPHPPPATAPGGAKQSLNSSSSARKLNCTTASAARATRTTLKTARTKEIQSLTADQLLRMRAATRKLIPRDLVADKYIPTLALRNARMLQFPTFATLHAIDKKAEEHDIVDPRHRALEKRWISCTFPARDPLTLKSFDMGELVRLPNPSANRVVLDGSGKQHEFLAASGANRAVRAINDQLRSERTLGGFEYEVGGAGGAGGGGGVSVLGATYRSEALRRSARQSSAAGSPNASGVYHPPTSSGGKRGSSTAAAKPTAYELSVSRLCNMRFAFCNDMFGAPLGCAPNHEQEEQQEEQQEDSTPPPSPPAPGVIGIDTGDLNGPRATLFTLRFVPEHAAFHLEFNGVFGVGSHTKQRQQQQQTQQQSSVVASPHGPFPPPPRSASGSASSPRRHNKQQQQQQQQHQSDAEKSEPPQKKPTILRPPQEGPPLVWTIEYTESDEHQQSRPQTTQSASQRRPNTTGTTATTALSSSVDSSAPFGRGDANFRAVSPATASQQRRLNTARVVLRPKVELTAEDNDNSKDDPEKAQKEEAQLRQLWVLQPLYGGIPAGAEHYASAALLGVDKMTLSRSQRYEISPLLSGNRSVVEVATQHDPVYQQQKQRQQDENDGEQHAPVVKPGQLVVRPRREVPLPMSVFAVARDVRCVRTEAVNSIPRIAYHFDELVERKRRRKMVEEEERRNAGHSCSNKADHEPGSLKKDENSDNVLRQQQQQQHAFIQSRDELDNSESAARNELEYLEVNERSEVDHDCFEAENEIHRVLQERQQEQQEREQLKKQRDAEERDGLERIEMSKRSRYEELEREERQELVDDEHDDLVAALALQRSREKREKQARERIEEDEQRIRASLIADEIATRKLLYANSQQDIQRLREEQVMRLVGQQSERDLHDFDDIDSMGHGNSGGLRNDYSLANVVMTENESELQLAIEQRDYLWGVLRSCREDFKRQHGGRSPTDADLAANPTAAHYCAELRTVEAEIEVLEKKVAAEKQLQQQQSPQRQQQQQPQFPQQHSTPPPAAKTLWAGMDPEDCEEDEEL